MCYVIDNLNIAGKCFSQFEASMVLLRCVCVRVCVCACACVRACVCGEREGVLIFLL